MPLLTALCRTCRTTVDYLSPKEPTPEACPTCGGPMVSGVTIPATGRVTGTDNRGGWKAGSRPDADENGDRDGWRTVRGGNGCIIGYERGNAPVMVDWVCEEGHRHFDVYSEKPTSPPTCPTCGGNTREVVGVPTMDWFTAAGFHASGGYHDDVLGRWVNSPEHRREILAEMGLAEGGEDSSALLRQAERKAEEERQDREVWEMLQVKLPDTPDVRKAKAEGLVPDEEWAKQDLQKMYGWK